MQEEPLLCYPAVNNYPVFSVLLFKTFHICLDWTFCQCDVCTGVGPKQAASFVLKHKFLINIIIPYGPDIVNSEKTVKKSSSSVLLAPLKSQSLLNKYL